MINLSRQQLFAVLIVTLLVMLLLGFLVGRFVVNQTVTVPDLTGKTLYDAIRAIEQAGLVFVGSIELANDTIFASRVIASSPPADIEVPRGSPVTLMVSNGPHFIRYAKPGGSDSGDCITWGDACNLQHALDKAKAGDEIWVETGVHKPGTDRNDTFQLKNGVALYGGFAGSKTSRDERNWEENITILSGDIDDNDITANGVITTTANITGTNSYHVVTGSGRDDTAILDGFTITGGQANGRYSDPCRYDCGGGMYNEEGSPTLANVVFSGNHAGTGGGGMYNFGGSPVLTATQFVSNTTNQWGGGMFNSDNSEPQLTDVTFSGNRAEESGGGMHNFQNSPALTVTYFINNTAPRGGGIHNHSSSPTVVRTTFNGNTATQDGGGMYNEEGSPTLANVVFSDNSAGTHGGGMYNTGSSPTLTSTNFINNTAIFGGGMYNTGSSPILTGTKFISNTAILDGGGMCNDDNSSPKEVRPTYKGNKPNDRGGDAVLSVTLGQIAPLGPFRGCFSDLMSTLRHFCAIP